MTSKGNDATRHFKLKERSQIPIKNKSVDKTCYRHFFGTYGKVYSGKSAVKVLWKSLDGWELKSHSCQGTEKTPYPNCSNRHSAANWILPCWLGQKCMPYAYMLMKPILLLEFTSKIQCLFFRIVVVGTETKAGC